jgi:hypothetical protein
MFVLSIPIIPLPATVETSRLAPVEPGTVLPPTWVILFAGAYGVS